MTKTLTVKDEVFNELSITKNGLGISWSDYLQRLYDNSDRMYLAEHNLIKANERIAELEREITS